MRKAKLRSVSFPIQRTRVTRVTRDVFFHVSFHCAFMRVQCKNIIKKYLYLCSENERNSYRFGTINDRNVNFG